MKIIGLAAPLGALFLAAAALSGTAAYSAQPPVPQYGQNRGGWDTPPPEFRDIQRQGFRDGIEGARKDVGNQRRPDPNNRDEYRHPNLPRNQWAAYQEGFRRGYQRGIENLRAPAPRLAPPVVPVAPPPGRNSMSGPVFDIRHRGFQDGMNGALKDLGNHRRPDPNNRDEYRYPSVPPQMAEPYRDGFRHGYDAGIRELTSMPDSWRMGPQGDARVRGYHDGAEGAIRDWDNRRRPDPSNRDEYRRPSVPYELQEAYRDGFRRGYQRIARELNGYFGAR